MKTQFGKVEKVDLHELWKGEATDFKTRLNQQVKLSECGKHWGQTLKPKIVTYFTFHFNEQF